MRVRVPPVLAVAVCLVAACGSPADSPAAHHSSGKSATQQTGRVDPSRIKRVSGALPDGYEVADASGVDSPAHFWGLRDGSISAPAQCAALVDAGADGPAVGVSGSGAGGILYVVAVPGPVAPDVGVRNSCGHWVMSNRNSTADISLVDAPSIERAQTVGMTATIHTAVESGSQTESRASTFTAYADGQLVFVTLVVDPGSPLPALDSRVAAELLVDAVAVLRG